VQLSQGEKNVLLYTFCLVVLIGLALLAACPAHAQEVIMNQPSADVVDKGKTFVRFDEFYTQNPAFYQENLNLAYGLGHLYSYDGGLEVSLNNTNAFNRFPMQDSLVAGFKYAPIKYNNGEWYVGYQFIQPLTNKMPGFSQGDIVYGAYAQKFGKDGQWRLTGGAFYSHNGVQVGNRAGAIGGIEYMKMFKNGWGLGPGVDYASGAGTNGYVSPGLMFMKGSFFICPGYMIANPKNPNGAHQTFVMIGKTF
jgi:hypothetical protein